MRHSKEYTEIMSLVYNAIKSDGLPETIAEFYHIKHSHADEIVKICNYSELLNKGLITSWKNFNAYNAKVNTIDEEPRRIVNKLTDKGLIERLRYVLKEYKNQNLSQKVGEENAER